MTAIANRVEFDELCDHLAKDGLDMPRDVTTVEEFGRRLLAGLKTKAAVQKLRDEREEKRRAAKRPNPDAPREGDEEEKTIRQTLAASQFSTGSDEVDAKLASKLVDASERHQRNPNFAPDPFKD